MAAKKISRGIVTNGAVRQWGQRFYAQQNGSLGVLTHWIVMACDRWLRTKAARGGLNRTNLTISHSTSADATRLAFAQAKYVFIAQVNRLEGVARISREEDFLLFQKALVEVKLTFQALTDN